MALGFCCRVCRKCDQNERQHDHQAKISWRMLWLRWFDD